MEVEYLSHPMCLISAWLMLHEEIELPLLNFESSLFILKEGCTLNGITFGLKHLLFIPLEALCEDLNV